MNIVERGEVEAEVGIEAGAEAGLEADLRTGRAVDDEFVFVLINHARSVILQPYHGIYHGLCLVKTIVLRCE